MTKFFGRNFENMGLVIVVVFRIIIVFETQRKVCTTRVACYNSKDRISDNLKRYTFQLLIITISKRGYYLSATWNYVDLEAKQATEERNKYVPPVCLESRCRHRCTFFLSYLPSWCRAFIHVTLFPNFRWNSQQLLHHLWRFHELCDHAHQNMPINMTMPETSQPNKWGRKTKTRFLDYPHETPR